MAHFAGLDVSIEETAVCVVDDQEAVAMQCSVPTEPESIAEALAPFAATLKCAGHEVGSLSPWLHPELKALGVPVVCLEVRQVCAAMSAQRNETDATDAPGPGAFATHRLVPPGVCEDRWRLPAEASFDPSLQPGAEVPRPRDRHSPLAEELRVRINKVGRGGGGPQARRHHARDVAGRHGLRRSAARRRQARRRADRQGTQASRRSRMTFGSPFNRQPASP